MKENKTKHRKVRRELIEWAIILGVGLVLYLTGLHTQVIGTLQGLILKTGIIKPDISSEMPIAEAQYHFRLMDQEGKMVDGTTLEGKTVFMNFWATWCPPCIAEMPDINALYAEMHQDEDIRFILISLDEDFDKAIKFVEKKGFDFRIYRFASPIPKVFESRTIPTTYILSPEGNIVVKKQGMARYNSGSFRNFLKSLSQKKQE